MMNPLNFMVLAKKMQAASEESERRTAINRAYYAVYNHLAGFFRKNGLPVPRNVSGHTRVVDYLSNSNINIAGTIASYVRDLRQERNDADYEMEQSRFGVNTSQLIVMKAEMTLEEFDNLAIHSLIKNVRKYCKLKSYM